MKRIITVLLVLITATAYAQPQSGGEIWGYKIQSALRGRVMLDSTALRVSDSLSHIYGNRLNTMQDSLVSDENEVAQNKYGIKMMGTVYNGTTPSYSDAKQRSIVLNGKGELMVSQASAGRVSVYQENRGSDVGNYVEALIDTFGNTRVVIDSNSRDALMSIQNSTGAIEAQTTIFDPGYTTANSGGNPTRGVVVMGTDLSQPRPILTDGGGRTLVANGGTFAVQVDSSTQRKGVVILNDSLRVFATNGFGGGSSSTVIRDSSITATSMTITALNSLASSATVGWESDRIDIRGSNWLDMKAGIKLTMSNTAPANDKAVYVYAIPWWYDGSSWYSASGGTTTLPSGSQASYTFAQPCNFRLLGVLSYTTQNMVLQDHFLLSNAFGANMPDGVSFFVLNYTGSAVAASTNLLYYSPILKTQR